MKKRVRILLTVIMISGVLFACDKENVSNKTHNSKLEENSSKDETKQDQSSELEKDSTEENKNLTSEEQKLDVTIYSSNENANGLIETTVEIERLSENLIIDELIKSDVLKEGTVLNKFEKKTIDGQIYLILDFNEKFADLLYSCGSSGELMVVGSMVNTFLDAYEADLFTFTVNGEIFESGHVIYDEAFQHFQFNE